MNTPPRATVAFQELIGSLRQHWANQLYPALHQRYREIDQGTSPAMADQAIAQVSQAPLYQWFAFIDDVPDIRKARIFQLTEKNRKQVKCLPAIAPPGLAIGIEIIVNRRAKCADGFE